MNNLEQISFHDVQHIDGSRYNDWRKKLRPNYRKVCCDIAWGYAAIILTLMLCSLIPTKNILFLVVGLLLGAVSLGFFLAYVSLFLHEAGHFNLHANKKQNDRLATIFICIPFGIDIRSYRKIHWHHHLQLGTTTDPENSYFNALTSSFLLETFTGLHLLKTIRTKNANTLVSAQMKKDSFKMLLMSAAFNGALLLLFILIGNWQLAIAWTLGMLLFFPFFATLRQVLEHRDELSNGQTDFKQNNHGKVTRLFLSDGFSRLFGAAGFNKHMIHHWDPQLSYTVLKEVELFLTNCDATKQIIASSKTSYFSAFRKLVLK